MLALDEDEIHVWRVGVSSAYTRRDVLWSFLADDERQKATDFLFDDDRERFIVSEGCCGRSWGVTSASIPAVLASPTMRTGNLDLPATSEFALARPTRTV